MNNEDASVVGAGRRHHWAAALTLVLVTALAGCGARVAPGGTAAQNRASEGVTGESDAESSAVTVQPGAGPAEIASTSPPPPTGETAAADASEQPTPDPWDGPMPAHHNTVAKIALSAACVRPGDLLTVTITGPPSAGVAAVIGFSDGQSHGATIFGETDPTGRYVWRVLIEPTVPAGKARALASVTGPNRSSEGGGSADKPFQVADLSGCP